jgi:hypothetical protein
MPCSKDGEELFGVFPALGAVRMGEKIGGIERGSVCGKTINMPFSVSCKL